ncbi:hypothetical protein ACFCWG_39305 [Streptomyces sp. NPDC056390]|uniref:hypothetical protein n=1 Tax=Streptomyces sp. NPDC056390 TaxID=3345806 RepID=UPI0035E3B1B3
MNDSGAPTRLDMLRFLERVQVADLDRTRKWIAAEERREAERQRDAPARSSAPDWLIAMGSAGGTPWMGTSAAATWRASAIVAPIEARRCGP